jgi:tetratricopeptide (TPR) repeat protein
MIAEDESLPPSERAEALLLTAHRYRMDGRQGRSRQLYEILIRDVPGRIGAEAQEGLAGSYAEEGMLDEAAEAYLAVPYLFPDQTDLASRALREAEKLYREAGRDDEADKIHSRIQ